MLFLVVQDILYDILFEVNAKLDVRGDRCPQVFQLDMST